jgi:hypothetical protein
MEWFEINWRGPYSLETSKDKRASESFGVYAIFEKSRSFKLLYIGETYWQTFGKRLKQHQREWLDNVRGQKIVAFGDVQLSEGKHISHERVIDVENALIHYLRPPYNTIGKRGYSGREILIFNTGKPCSLDKIVCHESRLMTLLKKSFR